MGQKIKNDLEGVVYVGGQTLKAGDDVPEGAEVGAHLLEGASEDQPTEDQPEARKSGEPRKSDK